MNLNDKDQIVFDALKSGKKVENETLMELTATGRHAQTVHVKYLSAKVAPYGWIIERVSPIGRGHKAVYQMKKLFSPKKKVSDDAPIG